MSEMYRGRWVGEDSTDVPGVVFSAQAGQQTPDLDRPHFFPGSQCKEEGFLTPHAGRVQALELICIQGSAQGPSVRMSTWENFHLRLQSASPPLCMLEESVSLFLFFLFPPAAMATKEHP